MSNKDLTIKELLYEYAVVRGDIAEPYARAQLQWEIENRIAKAREDVEKEYIDAMAEVMGKWNDDRYRLSDALLKAGQHWTDVAHTHAGTDCPGGDGCPAKPKETNDRSRVS